MLTNPSFFILEKENTRGMTETFEPQVLTVCLNPTLQRTVTLGSALRVGDVNRATSVLTTASGKGVNVARVLEQLGVCALHLCQAHATAPTAARFLALASADDVHVTAVDPGTDADVRCCTTLVDTSTRTATEIVEPGARVAPETPTRVLAALETVLATHAHSLRAVVISGSAAPGFAPAHIAALAHAARAHGLLVVLDVRGADLAACLACRPDIVKPNATELAATFPDAAAGTAAALGACAMRLWREHGTRAVITRGAEPTLFVDAHGVLRTEPVVPLAPEEIANTIGCGDSFAAGFVAAAIARPRDAVPADGDDSSDWVLEAVRAGHRAAAQNAHTLSPGSLH